MATEKPLDRSTKKTPATPLLQAQNSTAIVY
jgi:hypothetical protein